jgi:hypothetical protein
MYSSRSDESPYEKELSLKEQLDTATRVACELSKLLIFSGHFEEASFGARQWYRKHQALDDLRRG